MVTNEKPEELAPEPVEVKTVSRKPMFKVPSLSAGWWAIVAVLAFFALVGLVAIGFALSRGISKGDHGDFRGGLRGTMTKSNGDPREWKHGSRDFGMMGSASSTTQVSGVVTAVNGNSITVAANGSTTNVITSDSTTYTGAASPAQVNDSIMVSGTASADTADFNATRIVLRRS